MTPRFSCISISHTNTNTGKITSRVSRNMWQDHKYNKIFISGEPLNRRM